jgi:inorganic phosphate transporter, PiT family
MLTLVIIGVIIALTFDFLNGMNDAGNSIATIVSTKVLPPYLAVIWAAFFNFAAAFLFEHHVANTVGKGIVDTTFVNPYFIIAALVGASAWVFFCARKGIPISVSHSLIGGLIGCGLIEGGTQALYYSGISKVIAFIVISPAIGMVLGYFISITTLAAFKKTSPRKVDKLFRGLQLFSSAIFSLGHGANDAQKTMGVIALLLFSTGYLGNNFHIPLWVVFSAYGAISLGTLTGAWKTIKTLGVGLTHLKPFQGFCAETGGAIMIITNSFLGIPVSTTHTITGSIIGVGMTKRVSAVRWGLASNIIIAWIITIPSTMIVAGAIYAFMKLFI